jgi:hypothetical protein
MPWPQLHIGLDDHHLVPSEPTVEALRSVLELYLRRIHPLTEAARKLSAADEAADDAHVVAQKVAHVAANLYKLSLVVASLVQDFGYSEIDTACEGASSIIAELSKYARQLTDISNALDTTRPKNRGIPRLILEQRPQPGGGTYVQLKIATMQLGVLGDSVCAGQESIVDAALAYGAVNPDADDVRVVRRILRHIKLNTDRRIYALRAGLEQGPWRAVYQKLHEDHNSRLNALLDRFPGDQPTFQRYFRLLGTLSWLSII